MMHALKNQNEKKTTYISDRDESISHLTYVIALVQPAHQQNAQSYIYKE